MKAEGGNRRKGFSLVEIMIVVVIIGLMAGLITYATSGYLARAKAQRAKADLRTLAGAVDSFYGNNSRYPSNQEGLKALVGQYIQVLQNDPWGRPYLYVQPGRNGAPFEIVTYGADGREGGTGADADLTNNDVDVVTPAKK
jgi:general secretion pathway protein G